MVFFSSEVRSKHVGRQVGHVPGEDREKSMGRESLHAPSPQGVLHAWKRQVSETQLWLAAEHRLSSSHRPWQDCRELVFAWIICS